MITPKELESIYEKGTTNCSTICRTIVFALLAVIWSIYNKDGAFQFSITSSLLMGGLIFYLFVDIAQYLVSSLMYKYFFYKLNNGRFSDLDDDEKIAELLDKTKEKNDHVAYILFIIKLSVLVFWFILFVIVNLSVCFQ